MTPSTIPTIRLEGRSLPVQEIKDRCFGAVKFFGRAVTAGEIWRFVDPFQTITDEIRTVTLNSLVFERRLIVERFHHTKNGTYQTHTSYRIAEGARP